MRNPWPLVAATTLALVCGASSHGQASSAVFPPAEPARVIVKFKPGAESLQPRALSVQRSRLQAAALGRRAGLSLTGGPVIAERTHVVTAAGMDSEALARKLAADGDVEYAVPDQWRHVQAAPNDPRYASGLGGTGPSAGQWYLRAPTGSLRSAINAEGAWDVTVGSPSVPVPLWR